MQNDKITAMPELGALNTEIPMDQIFIKHTLTSNYPLNEKGKGV